MNGYDDGFGDYPFLDLDSLILPIKDTVVKILENGKWVSGRFDGNIRIDPPRHGAGQTHAHVYGRKGNEIVVVNLDGTASHGTKGRLHRRDAEVLQQRGYNVTPGQIIEWFVPASQPRLLLG